MHDSQQLVLEFLRNNPDFLEKNPELLADIELSSEKSLYQRQIQVLRNREEAYKEQIKSIVDNAQYNEDLENRMHNIALDLIAYISKDTKKISQKDFLQATIQKRLNVEYSVVLIEEELANDQNSSHNKQILALYSDLITRVSHQGSTCDNRISSELRRKLFHSEAGNIASCAFIPVLSDYSMTSSIKGVLTLGARDPDRFNPHLGSVYLNRLGELIGAWYS